MDIVNPKERNGLTQEKNVVQTGDHIQISELIKWAFCVLAHITYTDSTIETGALLFHGVYRNIRIATYLGKAFLEVSTQNHRKDYKRISQTLKVYTLVGEKEQKGFIWEHLLMIGTFLPE